ncbi:hypothetical protein GH714_031953 [Hevea brasiliensis]|uniref:Uncharacterized protein n=1 Tax=Hevea brasiliensis TaxID=3981 RepID=A0A6A6NDK9_HEVBR|nr:hypothetical protein GH714_031953 [Hevea brasiliensis]
MGSLLMDPEDIVTLAGIGLARNITTICLNMDRLIHSTSQASWPTHCRQATLRPPIGSALVDKLDLLPIGFMPIYLVKNGLVINVFSVKLKNYLIVQSIALISSFGKFLGTFLASSYSNIPLTDAASLGLVMNAQGVLELGMFKMMKKNKGGTGNRGTDGWTSQHQLTMIRLLEYGSITNDNARRRRLDNEVVSEFRTATAGNYRGHHDNKSPIVSGLADWNDYKELGTIGDLLVSSQFMDKTTILVVQQHNNVINEGCEIDRTVPDFEAEDLPIFRRVTD